MCVHSTFMFVLVCLCVCVCVCVHVHMCVHVLSCVLTELLTLYFPDNLIFLSSNGNPFLSDLALPQKYLLQIIKKLVHERGRISFLTQWKSRQTALQVM